MAREEADAADLVDDIDRSAANIPSWATSYWDAFAELTNDRRFVAESQSLPSLPGAPPIVITTTRELAIPFGAIDTYAQRYGIEGEEFSDFLFLIRAMDLEYRKIADERRANQTSSSESTNDDGD